MISFILHLKELVCAMMKNVLSCIVMFGLIGGSLGAQSNSVSIDPSSVQGTITVAAAANLASVGETLKTAFQARYPKVKIDFVFGASGALSTQIQNGAPFHIFLSADLDFPQKLATGGLTSGAPKVYALGTIILFSVQARDFSKGMEVLKDSGISRFALANPEIAPYGRAGQDLLLKTGLWDAVKAKVVTAQSITQAIQFTMGATGIGIINKSALYTKDLATYISKEGSHWFEPDTSLYRPISQAFVVLKDAASNQATRAFAAFLEGPEAQSIFLKAGYALP